MQSQLKKAIDLSKKTGDRVIVFESPESENAFVVIDLEQYQYMMDVDGEGECGDDCDGDCDCGHDHDHNRFEPEDYDDEPEVPENDFSNQVANLTEEELLDKINRDIALWKEGQKELEAEDSAAEAENETGGNIETEIRNKSKWAIRNEIKENADEIIEEDRHYLEEVKY